MGHPPAVPWLAAFCSTSAAGNRNSKTDRLSNQHTQGYTSPRPDGQVKGMQDRKSRSSSLRCGCIVPLQKNKSIIFLCYPMVYFLSRWIPPNVFTTVPGCSFLNIHKRCFARPAMVGTGHCHCRNAHGHTRAPRQRGDGKHPPIPLCPRLSDTPWLCPAFPEASPAMRGTCRNMP